ncbi:MAG: 30S ribosomal protein S16 [Chloroflexi bacterium]|nr:30S ribosomal protein S16 [Chloroflexota bacterium]
MLKIKLQRIGAKKQPYYRVVVAEARSAPGSLPVEVLGHYAPLREPEQLELKKERAQHWLAHGAQPTDRALRLLRGLGLEGLQALPPLKAHKGKKKERAASPAPATPAPPSPEKP